MVQLLDSYQPLVIGRFPYIAEMSVSEPFVYAVGFEEVLDSTTALDVVHTLDGEWRHTEPDYIGAVGTPRTEYRFVNTDARQPLSPADLSGAITGSDLIRYVVPMYSSDELGSAFFSLIPNHVLVSSADLNFVDLAEFDQLAESQGFFPLLYRDVVVGGRSRRIYSSLVGEPAMVRPEMAANYRGEPGAALWFIAELVEVAADRDSDLVAEPDWYTKYPNDLATSATRLRDDGPTYDLTES